MFSTPARTWAVDRPGALAALGHWGQPQAVRTQSFLESFLILSPKAFLVFWGIPSQVNACSLYLCIHIACFGATHKLAHALAQCNCPRACAARCPSLIIICLSPESTSSPCIILKLIVACLSKEPTPGRISPLPGAQVRFSEGGERFAAIGQGGMAAAWRLDAPTFTRSDSGPLARSDWCHQARATFGAHDACMPSVTRLAAGLTSLHRDCRLHAECGCGTQGLFYGTPHSSGHHRMQHSCCKAVPVGRLLYCVVECKALRASACHRNYLWCPAGAVKAGRGHCLHRRQRQRARGRRLLRARRQRRAVGHAGAHLGGAHRPPGTPRPARHCAPGLASLCQEVANITALMGQKPSSKLLPLARQRKSL